MRLTPDTPERYGFRAGTPTPGVTTIQYRGSCDGDTFRIAVHALDTWADKIRILEIQAPEAGERGWMQSRLALHQLIHGPDLVLMLPDITPIQRDPYNRLLAWPQNRDGDVATQMVRRGWAVPFGRYGHSRRRDDLRSAWAMATADGVGLHAPDPLPRS